MEKVIKCLSNIAIIVVWLCAIVCTGVVCVAFCMEYLKMTANSWNALVAIGTLAAAVIALVMGVWGDRLKNCVAQKPKISVKNILKTRQQYIEFGPSNGHPARLNICEFYRLEIVNDSAEEAKGIVADIVEITSVNGVTRNLIPAPLQWTHLKDANRNIAPGQSVYLDFIQSKQTYQNAHPTSFVLPLLSLNPHMINVVSSCFVKIKCYGENIKPKEFNLKVDYQYNNGNFPFLDIQIC